MTVTATDLAALRANAIHNRRERGYAATYGTLICDCSEPDADPRRDAGMCQRCSRKPLALMAVSS